MKTKLFTLIMIAVCLSFAAQSQGVPNGNFEIWNTIPMFEEPDGYSTSNRQSFIEAQKISVIKSTDAVEGKYSIRLNSFVTPTDTQPGLAAFSSDLEYFTDGFPFTAKPDSLKLSMKYHCANNDSAVVAVLFLKSGFPIGLNIFTVYGDQNTWKEMSFAIDSMPANPDTALFILASGYPDGDVPNNIDNWLMVDDISFTGTTQNVPNAGFENWKSFGSEEPFGWNTFNTLFQLVGIPPYAFKSNDAQEGNYAMEINTIMANIDSNAQPFGIVTTGQLMGDDFGGGFKLNNKPDSVTFYYKYDNSKNTDDTALFYISFSKFNPTLNKSEIVDSNMLFLPGTADYTYKSLTFNLAAKDIDSTNIVVGSSNFLNPAVIGIGNKLKVDNILLYFKGVGIPVDELKAGLHIYPNPANQYISFDNRDRDITGIVVTDLTGKVVMEEDYSSGSANLKSVNVSGLQNGIYLVTVFDNNGSAKSDRLIINR